MEVAINSDGQFNLPVRIEFPLLKPPIQRKKSCQDTLGVEQGHGPRATTFCFRFNLIIAFDTRSILPQQSIEVLNPLDPARNECLSPSGEARELRRDVPILEFESLPGATAAGVRWLKREAPEGNSRGSRYGACRHRLHPGKLVTARIARFFASAPRIARSKRDGAGTEMANRSAIPFVVPAFRAARIPRTLAQLIRKARAE